MIDFLASSFGALAAPNNMRGVLSDGLVFTSFNFDSPFLVSVINITKGQSHWFVIALILYCLIVIFYSPN